MTSDNRKRILILDDDETVRTMFGSWLTEEGYNVTHTADASEAISLHRKNPFDVAVIELVMGNFNGFETFATLRREVSPPKIIVTSKSGRTPPEIHLKMARYLGAKGTIAKPFTAEEIIAVVRSVLAAG